MNDTILVKAHLRRKPRPQEPDSPHPQQEHSMNNATSYTDESFDREVLRAAKPVLVDFWAPWCGPCKAVAPLLESLAEQYEGRVSIVKINVDENTEIAQKWNIRAIPTLILFKDGEAVEIRVGALDETELKNLIEGAL